MSDKSEVPNQTRLKIFRMRKAGFKVSGIAADCNLPAPVVAGILGHCRGHKTATIHPCDPLEFYDPRRPSKPFIYGFDDAGRPGLATAIRLSNLASDLGKLAPKSIPAKVPRPYVKRSKFWRRVY